MYRRYRISQLFSGLTEAFYRRLPILALTSTRPLSYIGNHLAQVIDRTAVPNDIVKISVFAPLVKDSNDEWDCQLKVNRALIALKKDGGGLYILIWKQTVALIFLCKK